MRWVGFTWLSGTFAVALWHLAGWIWVQRSIRGRGGRELAALPTLGKLTDALGIRRAVRLVECARFDVPAVMGVIRPVILIPLGFFNHLTPEQVEAILLHELAHIRRHDYLVNLLQVVVESLLFYHPATWWISSQIRKEREHCCDDIVASRCTAKRYVSALLALEQRRWPMANAVIAATGGTLLERVQRLLGRRTPTRRRPFRSALAALTVMACISLPIAMQGCDKSKPSQASAASASIVDADAKSEGITDDDLKPDYSVDRIGPGDVLEVIIGDLAGPGVQTTKKAIVNDQDGAIAMPLILTGIQVAGLTDVGAQQAIAKAYRDAKIISDAQVSVSRIDPRSTVYTVLGGGVGKPGEFTMQTPEARLTSALVVSSARLDGQKMILITRRNGSATRTLKISVAELMSGDSKFNVFLRPGDVIMLPPLAESPSKSNAETQQSALVDSPKYYVAGNAALDGVYPIPPENMTLKQAIIEAGGQEAAYVSVARRDGANEAMMLQSASVHDLNSGVIPDLIVHAGDTITLTLEAEKWKGATSQQALTP